MKKYIPIFSMLLALGGCSAKDSAQVGADYAAGAKAQKRNAESSMSATTDALAKQDEALKKAE